jgi:flagellar biosynthesis component FlhA
VEIEIKRIDSEVEAKLKQLVKDKEVVIRLALSFGWLAIIMICFFFTIFLLSDLFKFVSYLKKKYYNRVNKKKFMNYQLIRKTKERDEVLSEEL